MGRMRAFPTTTATAAAAELFDVDVLVIGAGMAGAQAARSAAALGARVLVVDRHPCPTGLARQDGAGCGRPSGTGRARGVLWLDGHSALELLVDAQGAVRGAAGIAATSPGAATQAGSGSGTTAGSGARARPAAPTERPWRAQAAAVVLATGQGLLMAVEAGAQLVGMDQRGGLRPRGAGGATTVAGLYAAGSAAWQGDPRDRGLPPDTAARALLSGQLAGAAAATEAARHGPVPDQLALLPAGRVGLRGPGSHPISPQATCAALQAVLEPTAQGAASSPGLTAAALLRLDALWHFLRSAAPAPLGVQGATRDAASRLAIARWRLRTLLARQRSATAQQPILSGGLDEVWAETEAAVWSPPPAGRATADPLAACAATAHRLQAQPSPQRLAAFAR